MFLILQKGHQHKLFTSYVFENIHSSVYILPLSFKKVADDPENHCQKTSNGH